MDDAQTATTLLNGFSLEMTGRDVDEVSSAQPFVPADTRVNITYLASEDPSTRLTAARAVLDAGLVPVPHVSARRMRSRDELDTVLGAFRETGAAENVFVLGGDPPTPDGPYASALEVIRTGVLAEHGVRHVSISGYPDGHPDISRDVLWGALRDKAAALTDQGLDGTVITQFGFDEEPVLAWIEQVRDLGIHLPVRVGIPGPAGAKRLLAFAHRFGVTSSAAIVKKYGFSVTNLMGTAGPDNLIDALADHYDPVRHGDVLLHIYTFGGMTATARWTRDFVAERASAHP
ncbi:methylenetetrahydrofolate reductase [Georgenia sp. 10Sc9-8]|uniref:Methylenetetrahydrofolate reductase n=1 Tax=Georgenia halotolerans TaxID=3028317 RepID=A0ABT5TXT3_9MICO|nr:methylenetetrahydrofolate reductase [Georgenia halotolerans]